MVDCGRSSAQATKVKAMPHAITAARTAVVEQAIIVDLQSTSSGKEASSPRPDAGEDDVGTFGTDAFCGGAPLLTEAPGGRSEPLGL
jgi:hypothetical protein